MILQQPPFDADPDVGADWLELKTLASANKRIIFSDIERAWEARRESENTDFEGDIATFDDWLNERTAIMQTRGVVLGESYPFEFFSDDREFIFKQPQTLGHSVYLLCLFLSAFSEAEIFTDTPRISRRLRDFFQAVAAWAACAIVVGSSYAFGWPRPEGTPFLTALKDVYETRMSDGEAIPKRKAPKGASGREKDSGIDIIAWRERIDKMSGKIYLLAQVASGKNWRDKAIGTYISSLHNNWFAQIPVSAAIPGMFIPFSLRLVSGATAQEQLRFDTPTFGNIYYRDVIAAYAEEGIALARRNASILCHRSNEAPALGRHMRRYIKLLERAQ